MRLGALATLLLGLACACLPVHRERPAVTAGTGTIVVEMRDFRSDRGNALVSLFSTGRGFPEDADHSVATLRTPITNGLSRAVFPDVPFGEYAVSVLHDEDGDGGMARSWIGAPLEGHGASNNPQLRRGPPGFEESSFLLVARELTKTVRLSYAGGPGEHRRSRRAARRGERELP